MSIFKKKQPEPEPVDPLIEWMEDPRTIQALEDIREECGAEDRLKVVQQALYIYQTLVSFEQVGHRVFVESPSEKLSLHPVSFNIDPAPIPGWAVPTKRLQPFS